MRIWMEKIQGYLDSSEVNANYRFCVVQTNLFLNIFRILNEWSLISKSGMVDFSE